MALLIAACSSNAATTTTTAESTTAPSEGTTAAAMEGTIEVTLADVSANSMLLTPSPTSAPAGEVTFDVTNSGNVEHEFVVIKTDLSLDDLPYDDSADEVIEDGEGMTPIDEIEEIQPGETKTLTVSLDAGNYVLICNLEGHFRMGMRSTFTVSG
jgi:uncharacterized cupredoxin-like copper-binding protein